MKYQRTQPKDGQGETTSISKDLEKLEPLQIAVRA